MGWDGGSQQSHKRKSLLRLPVLNRAHSSAVEIRRLVVLKLDWDLTTPSLKKAWFWRDLYNRDCVRVFEGTQPEYACEDRAPVRARARVRFVPHGHPMLPGFVVEGVVRKVVAPGRYELVSDDNGLYYAHQDDLVGVYLDEGYVVLRSFDGEQEKLKFEIEF